MSEFYKEYSKTVGTKKIDIKIVQDLEENGENYSDWEPTFLKLCSENNIETLFVAHRNGEVKADFKENSVYVYCNPNKTIISKIFEVDLDKNFNLESQQYDKHMYTPGSITNDGTFEEHGGIAFRNSKNPHEHVYSTFCFYIPNKNVFIFSDLYHRNGEKDILKYVSDMVKSGSYISIGNGGIRPAISKNVIQIADEETVTKIVKKNMKITTDAMNEQLQDKIEALNKVIEQEKRKQLAIPSFIFGDRYKVIKYVSGNKTCLGIATKISFKVDRIFYDEKTYDVSSLSHKRTVWACVMINKDSKVIGIRLYNSGFTDVFSVLHRRDSVFDGGHVICTGSYQDRISEVVINSIREYDKIIEITKEILCTIHSSGINGHSGDSDHEYRLLYQIREGKLEDHVIKSVGWNAVKKNKTCSTHPEYSGSFTGSISNILRGV